MATSSSQNFTQTCSQLIYDAFQLIGVYGVGRNISSEDYNFAFSLLNKLVKSWSTKGLNLWEKNEAVLHLTQYTSKYSIGNGTSDARCSLASDEVVTQLNGSLAANATSVTVDSTTGMTVGDYIGIVLSDKSSHWTTIATLPSSTTLTLTTGVSGAASDDALVYTFTNRIYKPLRILDARYLTGYDAGTGTSSVTERVITSLPYQDYFQLPSKGVVGASNQFLYVPGLTSGTFYLWPTPDDTNARITFTYERIIEDLDSASDNFDFPSEWLEPLTYQLAFRLGAPFGKDTKANQSIAPMAISMLQNLLEWNNEITSIKVTPDLGI